MNSSFKYLSFNSSAMKSPLAESTTIGSPMNQQESRGNQKRKTLSPLSNANKQRLQRGLQIEPHILTNAQSPGIVNRLMRYYEESQAESDKNRYVYNKVGDFPIVQLKKNEIKRNLVRSPSVRIAPPNKTIMNRDIRAAILRSNSFQLGSAVPKLMPTRMRAKDDSHQIILDHEPLPNIESPQSAKSVLDALEKNCRKRINNEELTLDRNKRVCATTQEVVDAPSRDLVPFSQQSGKRGRDQVSPIKSGGDSPNSQLSKRSRIRNNALLSSLSSSTYLVKPFTMRSSPSPPKVLPSSTITSTEAEASESVENTEKHSKEVETETQPEKLPTKPEPVKRLHLFNRVVDPSTFRPSLVSDDDDEVKINFVKPRETKSNSNLDVARSFEKDKLAMMLSGLSDGFESLTKETTKDSVDSVPATISFTTITTASTVSPITSPTSSNPLLASSIAATSANTLFAPTVKTTVPSETSKPVEAVKSLPTFQFGNNTPVSTKVTTSSTMPALQSVVAPIATSASTPSTNTSLTGGVLPLAAFSTSQQATTATTLADQSKPLITFTPISKNTSASIAPPITTTSASLPTNPTSATSMNNAGFSFGANKEPPKTSNGFSFGSNLGSSALTSSSLVANVSATPAVSTTTSTPSFNFQTPAATTEFNFGAKMNSTSTATPASNLSTGITSSFSNTAGALTSTVSFMDKPATTTASGVGFSFNAAPVNPVTTSQSSGFSFGSSQSTAKTLSLPKPEAAVSPSFNFGASNTNPLFGQSQNQPGLQQSGFPNLAQKTEAPSTGMFSFMQKAATPAVTTSSSSFSFGGPTPAPVQQASAFSFGQSNATAQPTSESGGIFSRLGDKAAEPKAAFSFGGNTQAQPTNVVSPFGNSVSNNANSQAAPLFGSTGNSAFNPSSGNNPFGNQLMQNNGFGGNTKPSSGDMFSFGSSNNNQQQSETPSTGMFNFGGQPSQANATFSLGGTGGSSVENVTESFTFKPSTGTVVNNNSAPSIFGQSQNSTPNAPPAYQFNNQLGNNLSTSFTFGGASNNSAQQNAPSSAGFNFNGPQTAPVSGAFNFQSAQPTLTPQPSPGGLFNIGTGGNQQQRRPIRQATRRMK